ncbi:hypothetical protein L9F63_020853, partial [Diploptera punctata]
VARERLDGSGINYPPQLPNERGDRAEKWMSLLISVIFRRVGFSSVLLNRGLLEATWSIVYGSSFGIIIVSLTQLALRACLLSEEIHHCPARYPDYKTAAMRAFDMNIKTALSIGISCIIIVLGTIIIRENPVVYVWNMGPLPNMMIYVASFCFSYLIRMEESTLNTSLQIMKLNSLDYGSGMAYNFFYGYLRLVLSVHEVGTTSKGIVGRIETYINKNNLIRENDPLYKAFPIKKLFILIPKNLFTPTDLKEVSRDNPNDGTKCWMEAAPSLESEILDRAGVKQRVYKNSVYKIRDPNNENDTYTYVVAEGATPLKTLWDVIKMNPKMSAIFKKHQEEIVSAFYKTLLEILNDSDECRGLCEVIYYVDTDKNNKKVNVAKIILQRIEELERKQER